MSPGTGLLNRCLHPLNHGRLGWWPDELDYRAPGHHVVYPIVVVPLDAAIRRQGLRYFSFFAARKRDCCHDAILLSLGVRGPPSHSLHLLLRLVQVLPCPDIGFQGLPDGPELLEPNENDQHCRPFALFLVALAYL
jgi:hypothetical protein